MSTNNSIEIEEVHLIISGRVQGVCYRDFVQQNSRKLGVKGWVKNLVDGRVEALLQGKKESLDFLIPILRDGPTLARVDNIISNWKHASQFFTSFEIKS